MGFCGRDSDEIYDPDADARYYAGRETELIARYRRLLRIQSEAIDRLADGDHVPYTHSPRNEPLVEAFAEIGKEIAALQRDEQRARGDKTRDAERTLEQAKRDVERAQSRLRELRNKSPSGSPAAS